MIRLINNKKLMGGHVNGPIYNSISWATVVVLGGLSIVYIGSLLKI
jgi:Mn2+/Fe2+ NRAMP family transporter